MDLTSVKNIHFVGIGGIGISAMARMMHARGKRVSGNDIGEFEINKALERQGIEVKIGKTIAEVPDDAELVVYSVAWNDMVPELLNEIRERGVPMLTYPQMLKLVSENLFTIAVSGTHGKTTTTAMTAKVLREGKLDPTVIVGSLLKEEDLGLPTSNGSRTERGTNFVAGESNYLVVEADEYRRAFLNLSPSILVITNIDLDHLDFYKDLADIQNTFKELVARLPADGALICNPNDPHVAPVAAAARCAVIDYTHAGPLGYKLKVPGNHNMQNAQAANAVGEFLGIDGEVRARALATFSGTWRRFDFLGETSTGVLIYDDYAHNPQKVRAALQGARELYSDRSITAVFQPHLYSRTKHLLGDFAQSFASADHVILAPIYASREAYDPSITSNMLEAEMKKYHGDVLFLENFQKIETHLLATTQKGDVVVCIGAGDISKFCEEFVKK